MRAKNKQYLKHRSRYLRNNKRRRADPIAREHDLAVKRAHQQADRERLNALCREYHERNKDRIKARREEKVKLFQAFIQDYKDQPCTDCKKSYPSYVMDFDHVLGEKRRAISDMSSCTLDTVITEIMKCEVVCSNCHRERTHQRRI